MIALALLGSIALVPEIRRGAAPFENRARIAEIEVSGPVGDLVLSLGAAGETRIEGALLAGERVRLSVPIAARGAAEPDLAPRISWVIGDAIDPDPRARGSVRFLGWSEDATRLDRLPPGLFSRPRPPVGPDESELPLAALALLPACFLLALATRERRATSILLSAGGAALVLCLAARRGEPGTAGVTVLELLEGSDLALEVRASFATASLAAADLASTALSLAPETARVVWTGSFERGSRWRASSPGSALYRLRAYDPGETAFAREENRSTPLAESWVREEGEWTARGAWAAGSPLPRPRPGEPPPGWLSAGLPQGVPVLLGRLDLGGENRGGAWIRLTGLR